MKHSKKQKELEATASIESKNLYKGKIFSLRRDTLHFDNQPPHDWDLIIHPGAVAILPVTKKGHLLLIQQWRRAVDEIIYELAAGTLEEGETPLACAQREIQEEVGVNAHEFIPLGGFYSAPGFCTEYIHLFIAKDLIESSLPQDVNEGIDVVEMTLDQALSLIDDGQIKDAKTISGIMRYQRWQEKH